MKKIMFSLLLLSVAAVHCQFEKEKQILDQMIQTGMQDWEVPGLATVVVKDGEVVFKRAYGVRSIASDAKVNGETLFAMASTTKAVVAIALGMLVDEGKLGWDDPVLEHLPNFQLSDPYIAANARVKDLLTHNLGIANADALWVLDSVSTRETLKRFKHTKTAYPLRGGFVYQNIMYAAAGEVIEAVSGVPWYEFVEKRVFQPLQMRRSQTRSIGILQQGNYATPHYNFDNSGVQIVDHTYSDQIGAAGMMWSSIDDISRYLKFIANKGIVKNDTLLQPNTFNQLFAPHTLIPEGQFYPTTQLTQPKWLSYGLGWFQHDYRGHKLDFHTGSLPGLVAIAGVIHDKNVAVYVFANMDHAELRHAILYQVMDLFAFGDTDTNWHPRIFELYEDRKKKSEARRKKMEAQRVSNTTPSLAMEAYAGTYHHELCGELAITSTKDQLQLNFNDFEQITAGHWHYDTFRTIPNKRWNTPQTMSFELNDKGEVTSLKFFGYTFSKQQ